MIVVAGADYTMATLVAPLIQNFQQPDRDMMVKLPLMIAAVFLHMVRVYFTGAYKKPRELNWIIGVVLLFLTLGFGYTGYLLPANNLSDGAATIGINMAKSVPYAGDLQAIVVFGGTDISTTNYVLRMYWWHVFILPFISVGLMLLHMALVWIQGVAEPH